MGKTLCGKAIYTKMSKAHKETKRINKENSEKDDRTALRPYICKVCGYIHLTSHPKKANYLREKEEIIQDSEPEIVNNQHKKILNETKKQSARTDQ